MRYTYHLMRGTRRPIWEDPYNQNGGTWRIKVNKDDSVSRSKLSLYLLFIAKLDKLNIF